MGANYLALSDVPPWDVANPACVISLSLVLLHGTFA